MNDTPNTFIYDDERNVIPEDIINNDTVIVRPPIVTDETVNLEKEDENPLDPGDDPTGKPLGKYKIETDEEIKGLPITWLCTWANCFTEPTWDRGLCIRSYDKGILTRMKTNDSTIGITTGRYHVDAKEVVWLEANIKYSNRRPIGWFRESDIWHSKKGIPKPDNGVTPSTAKKNINWLAWLAGGAAVLRLFT